MIQAFPRVFLCNHSQSVALYNHTNIFSADKHYTLLCTACEKYTNEASAVQTEVIGGFPISHATNKPSPLAVEYVDAHHLACTVNFSCEQEYILHLYEENSGTPTKLQSINLYAVENDLKGLYPFKGDLHLHSIFSDGANQPEEIAVESRRIGFDFIALTDHGKRFPSVELQKTFAADTALTFRLYSGEEVHLPAHQAHILNIGGSASVNDIFRLQPEVFHAEVAQLQTETVIPPYVDAYQYCAALWAFRNIKKLGGLSVFCHPYWRRPNGYNLCSNFTEAMLQNPQYDALELISGYCKKETESNNLQVARYYQLKGTGCHLPIVGVSDAHSVYPYEVPEGHTLFGSFYTIVFAADNTFARVQQAICDGQSLAAEHLQNEQIHLYGDYRLVKYALFLQREFIAQHDALAQKEAALMQHFLQGEAYKAEQKALSAEMSALYQSVFAW